MLNLREVVISMNLHVCWCADVGSTKPGCHVVDDSLIYRTSSACHYICLRLLPVSAICCVNCIPCSCILWRPIRV